MGAFSVLTKNMGSWSIKILCLWISCLLLIGNLCNAPISPKKRGYPCEGHGCGCKSAEDCLRHCCCRSQGHAIKITESPSGGSDNSKVRSNTIRYSFLRGLTCMGYPHKFSPFPNLVFLPQGSYNLPGETLQRFVREITSPILHQSYISPPEKPPRPLA